MQGPSAARFRRVRRIVPADADELGHVNNVVWVRFVVELAVAHSAAVGFTPAIYRRLRGWWIVHRHELEYRQAAWPDEEVVEETWVRSLGAARSVRESRFSRAGEWLVAASTEWVFADLGSLRPRRIPPELRSAFPLLDEPARPGRG